MQVAPKGIIKDPKLKDPKAEALTKPPVKPKPDDKATRDKILQSAKAIVHEKLSHQLSCKKDDPTNPEPPPWLVADNPDPPQEFWEKIEKKHRATFLACGYINWLRQNHPSESPEEFLKTSEKLVLPDAEKAKRRLRDIIGRETLWTCAEQLRNCPQMLNRIFHDAYENGSMNIDKLDLEKIHKQIEQFSQGELNFDDIDDLGRMNKDASQVQHKTFFEPAGFSVLLVLLKYFSGSILLKLWTVAILFFIYEYETLNIHVIKEQILVGLPALRFFFFLDLGLQFILWVNDWGLRIALNGRHCCKIPFWLGFRFFFHFLSLGVSVAVVTLGILKMDNESYFYYFYEVALLARVVLSIIPELFPFQPIDDTKPPGSCCRCTPLGTRSALWGYTKRVLFLGFVVITSSVYEWFLIIPTVSSMLEKPFCGDPSYHLFPWTNDLIGLNVQHMICLLSTIWLWIMIFITLLIDNGIFFVFMMSIVGWVEADRTQGSSRSNVSIHKDRLKRMITECFLTPDVSVDTRQTQSKRKSSTRTRNTETQPLMGTTQDHVHGPTFTRPEDDPPPVPPVETEDPVQEPPNDLVPPEPETKEPALKLWHWAVSEWYNQDLISKQEGVHLMDELARVEPHTLHSHDAAHHVAFWIGSLDLNPTISKKFSQIPSCSIIIPVYGEKLMFRWEPDLVDWHRLRTSPEEEFYHLIATYPEEWINFTERMSGDKFGYDVKDLHKWEVATKAPAPLKKELTKWLSLRDQYVYKTVCGACSYWKALRKLAEIEYPKITSEKAKEYARLKVQVILCVQIYQKRIQEDKLYFEKILADWLREFPCLDIVIDFDSNPKPNDVPYIRDDWKMKDFNTATFRVKLDEHKSDTLILTDMLPRLNVLRLENKSKGQTQGKAINQLNGLTYAFGEFIQVLDCNQGGHATEYLKMPVLLDEFDVDNECGPAYRIIGSREYIFTQTVGTVARCHALQEWSFGTIILRTYSALGIRLHYGHPDVFHGSWATANAGLSKVNPDINTSEDVFAGFKTMNCAENTKHVEYIQFQKGRETGLFQMQGFDRKISMGNTGLLRSRDVYHLLERLDFPSSFLLFQGVSGHFTTITLMMSSMRMYILGLFLLTLTGSSLKAIGGLTFSTEWILHCGFITIVPLIFEFVVEDGIVMGFIRALLFVPVSTIIYLFQMQSKHDGFITGLRTGRCPYIATGRGLQIYRIPISRIFSLYATTHFIPTIEIIALCVAYFALSEDLQGGTLPLIMIFLFCLSVLVTPQVFNPTIRGNSVGEVIDDFLDFASWVGKTQPRLSAQEWEAEEWKEDKTFSNLFLSDDYERIPKTAPEALVSLLFDGFLFSFWLALSSFALYPHFQFWLCNYIGFWSIAVIACSFIYLFLGTFEQSLRKMTFICIMTSMVVFFFVYEKFTFAELYIPGLVMVKMLDSLRRLIFDLLTMITLANAEDQKKGEKLLSFRMSLVNYFFFVDIEQGLLALVLGTLNFVVALLMRPFWATYLLFGSNYTKEAQELFKRIEEARHESAQIQEAEREKNRLHREMGKLKVPPTPEALRAPAHATSTSINLRDVYPRNAGQTQAQELHLVLSESD